MTIPEIYEKAHVLLEKEQPMIYKLGYAHPDYQQAIKDIVERLIRDNR